MITTVGMETIAWYRYEGTVDTEGIGIEMERLAARHMSHNIAIIRHSVPSLDSLIFAADECCE